MKPDVGILRNRGLVTTKTIRNKQSEFTRTEADDNDERQRPKKCIATVVVMILHMRDISIRVSTV